jgi:pimeloyl-ACP methyl ester carboxylesterase
MAVGIPAAGEILEGELNIPSNPLGLILFAHGSGSSHLSPRNQFVARYLNDQGFATLLFDLLTRHEELADMHTAHLRFNIEFLAERLGLATDWIRRREETRQLPVGYFGASTGAAAALESSLAHPVQAIVSRGGRPDLAGTALGRVKAPTLLIVGGRDTVVIDLNQAALDQLQSVKHLEIVPGASHLFEETGALEEVARLAAGWFRTHMGRE